MASSQQHSDPISGSGYLTACMAEMVGKTGKVVGIEHIPELVEQSKQNMKRGNADLLESGQVVLVTGDGRQGYENGKWKSNRKSQNFGIICLSDKMGAGMVQW